MGINNILGRPINMSYENQFSAILDEYFDLANSMRRIPPNHPIHEKVQRAFAALLPDSINKPSK